MFSFWFVSLKVEDDDARFLAATPLSPILHPSHSAMSDDELFCLGSNEYLIFTLGLWGVHLSQNVRMQPKDHSISLSSLAQPVKFSAFWEVWFEESNHLRSSDPSCDDPTKFEE